MLGQDRDGSKAAHRGRPRTALARAGFFATLFALMFPHDDRANAQAHPSRVGDVVSRVRLSVNKSQTLQLRAPVADALVGSSEIADVVPVSDRTLYILGRKVGTTNVTLFDAEKKLIGLVNIRVTPDVETLEAEIQGAAGPGVRVRAHGEKTILTGVARDAPTVDRAMQIAPEGTVNLTQVKSPQQVMLKVRFIEINRSAGRDFGVRFEYATRGGAARTGVVGLSERLSTTPSRGVGLFTDLIPAVAGAALSTNGSPQFAQIAARLISTNSQQLDLFITALEERGLARRLAEPNLVSMSGDMAEFHAGGEIPIPVASSTNAGIPTITIAYKEFGVKLSFTPTVLTNGSIHLRLEPEVSDIDPTISVNTGVITVPGLTKRRARTNVQLRDGQSFAIAGLLQNVSQRSVEQFPWLGSIPVLGALFRSSEFQSRETELVVIVTPQLVKPAKPGELITTPLDYSMPGNDPDLFINGKLEQRRNMREFVSTNGAQLGPHGHLLPGVVGDQMAPK